MAPEEENLLFVWKGVTFLVIQSKNDLRPTIGPLNIKAISNEIVTTSFSCSAHKSTGALAMSRAGLRSSVCQQRLAVSAKNFWKLWIEVWVTNWNWCCIYLSVERDCSALVTLYCYKSVAQKSGVLFIPEICVVVVHLLRSAAVCPTYTGYLRVGLSVDFLCIKM